MPFRLVLLAVLIAVIAASFDLAMACAVASIDDISPDDVVDIVDALVARSLLLAEDGRAAVAMAGELAPDVILIGEVRTRETMEHAITFSETGHLVLATLHANNANQAMDRVLHFFPEEQREQILLDLSFNLKATIAQQPAVSARCKRRTVKVKNKPIPIEQSS